jgi:hypothetical protein
VKQHDLQHIRFQEYRRRVVEEWPDSAGKATLLQAITESINALRRTTGSIEIRRMSIDGDGEGLLFDPPAIARAEVRQVR